jgi:hypothetical protein
LGGNGHFVAHFMVIDLRLPTGSPDFIHCNMKLTDDIRAQCDVLELQTATGVVLSGELTQKDGVKILDVTGIAMSDIHKEFAAQSNPAKNREQDLDSPSL